MFRPFEQTRTCTNKLIHGIIFKYKFRNSNKKTLDCILRVKNKINSMFKVASEQHLGYSCVVLLNISSIRSTLGIIWYNIHLNNKYMYASWF